MEKFAPLPQPFGRLRPRLCESPQSAPGRDLEQSIPESHPTLEYGDQVYVHDPDGVRVQLADVSYKKVNGGSVAPLPAALCFWSSCRKIASPPTTRNRTSDCSMSCLASFSRLSRS